ncbi:MAG: hypothetical protein ACO23H_12140 [Alphaproteobacteria bacterium]
MTPPAWNGKTVAILAEIKARHLRLDGGNPRPEREGVGVFWPANLGIDGSGVTAGEAAPI